MSSRAALGSAAADGRERFSAHLILAIAVVLLLLTAYPMLIGEVYSAGDLGKLYMPNREFYAECLANGDSPVWFPGGFCGYDLHATGQTGMYHPLHYLAYTFLPFAMAFNLEVWSSYPFMFIGMYLFLRRLKLGREAALFGALLFTFSAFNIQRLRHLNALAIIAQMPWVLYCADIIAREKNARYVRWGAAGLAILNASQLLLGYPQYFWFSSLLVGCYVVFLLARRDTNLVRAAAFAGATVLGILGGAVQLLPSMEASADSVRTVLHDDTVSFVGSLPPQYLAQAISPYCLKHDHNVRIYIGALPLLLALWAAVRWRSFGSLRGLVLATAIFALGMVWLALGKYGGLAYLQRTLPFIGDFRFPSRCVVLLTFAVSVLSAFALVDLSSLAREPRKLSRLTWMAILSVVILSVLVTARCFVRMTEQAQAMPGLLFLGSVFFVVGGALLIAAARGQRWAIPLLIVAAVADPAYYGLSYAVFGDFDRIFEDVRIPNHLPLDAELADFEPPPTTDKSYRLLGGPGYSLILVTSQGWKRLEGIEGLPPYKRLDYRTLPALRVSSTRWVHKEPPLVSFFGSGSTIFDSSKVTPLLGTPVGSWYEVQDVLPRVRCVTQTVVSQSPAEDIQKIDVANTALVSEPVSLENAVAATAGTATILEDRPGRIQVRVNVPSRQLLVLSESYHKSWRIEVDGQPGPTPVRTYGDFLGVVVEPGEHAVAFTYASASLRKGLLISLSAMAVMLALAASGFFGKRPVAVHAQT